MICIHNHTEHKTKIINVNLGGRKMPDAPIINSNMQLRFEIYDWKFHGYGTDMRPGFCPGKDNVSEAIETTGIWEAFETALILDILKEGNGSIIDIGCHIGWYSTICAKLGKQVFAFDGVPENLELLKRNIERNECLGIVETFNFFIDNNSPPVAIDKDILLFKCDLEGNDQFAVKMCDHLFAQRKIQFAIVEVSPIFNDSYPALVRKIMDYGYNCYNIPDKTFSADVFEKAPLEVIKSQCLITNAEEYVKTLRQSNFLFIRQ